MGVKRFLTVQREKAPLQVTYSDVHDVSTQALADLLAQAAEENRRRVWELRVVGVRLQCLRCRSEFTRRGNKEVVEEEEQGEEPRVPGNDRSRRVFEDGEEGTQWDNEEKGEKWVYEEGHNTS